MDVLFPGRYNVFNLPLPPCPVVPIKGDSLRYPPKIIEVWIQEATVLNSLTGYSSPPPPSSSATSSPLSSAPPSPSPPPPPLPSTSRLKSAPTSENEDEVEEDQSGNSDGSFDWDAFDEPGDLDGLP